MRLFALCGAARIVIGRRHAGQQYAVSCPAGRRLTGKISASRRRRTAERGLRSPSRSL